MQSLLTVLGSICLVVFAMLLLGLTQCRSDGCMAMSLMLSVTWVIGLVTLCAGIAVWRADREVADIGKSFKAVMSLLGLAVFLGSCFVLLALGA
jgi:hypothetical protein